MRQVWKFLGLAGVVGVAASGAAIARAERQRQAYTPDEVRAKLHERVAKAAEGSAAESSAAEGSAAENKAAQGGAAQDRVAQAGAAQDRAAEDGPAQAGAAEGRVAQSKAAEDKP
ncbi:hypothetical protein ACOBQX_11305 [Actinokineospora sp. G85]|uniref:hypothetical protein n=1 Tax=Actinokineospora sp. G85 TaxID=3406626 RepID=UPI003C781C87